MTVADRGVSLGVLVLSGALALGFRGAPGPAAAEVLVGSELVATLPLDQAATRRVEGRLGPTTLVVEDGTVRITKAPCAQHLCIAMGAKRHAGDLIACVPGGVIVRLRGGAGPDGETPDSVAR
jgi:hypothetical protein